jgi:hypothetical protein
MIQPLSLDINAYYRSQLSKDHSLYVDIYTSDKGKKTHLRITTTGVNGGGDFIISPDEIDKVADFVKESASAFAQLVKVNDAMTNSGAEEYGGGE